MSRCHTQTPAALGDEGRRTFGSLEEGARSAHAGGLSLGEKSLRASSLADRGDEAQLGRGEFGGGSF